MAVSKTGYIYIVKSTDNKWGLVDANGDVIIPCVCDGYKYGKDARLVFYKPDEVLIYNLEKGITKLPYKFLENSWTGVILEQNGKSGFYDYNKEDFIIQLEYDSIELFADNYLIVHKDSMCEIYNISGEKFSDSKYQNVEYFNITYNHFFIVTDENSKQSLFYQKVMNSKNLFLMLNLLQIRFIQVLPIFI